MINPSLKDYIFSLDDIRQDNIERAELFSYLFNQGPITDTKEHLLEHLSDIVIFSEDEDENISLIKEKIFPMIHLCNTEKYSSNPYNKLPIKEVKLKGYSLSYFSIKPYELFPLNDIKTDDAYNEISQVGYFENEYRYLNLLYKDSIWMSINPNEIETMEKDIESAYGNVLVLGLGLGYFPFMISLKDNVNKITIIECEQDIIDLFKKNIFPHFEHKEKIDIICDDAHKYIKESDLNKYDYIYVDIYHNNNDGLSHFYHLEREAMKNNKTFHYWLKDGFIALLRRCMIEALTLTLLNEKYANCGDFSDNIMKIYMNAVKLSSINNKDDITYLLKEGRLLEIIRNEKI